MFKYRIYSKVQDIASQKLHSPCMVHPCIREIRKVKRAQKLIGKL